MVVVVLLVIQAYMYIIGYNWLTTNYQHYKHMGGQL